MRHEHLVQINDPLMPLLTPITRRQLWIGLRLRAEDPTLFTPALDACRIDAREPADGREQLFRTLDFGNFVVNDRATLHAPDVLVIDTQTGPTWPASRLTIRIEEPEPDALFLRFVYESDEAVATELDAMADALRRQAYQAADLDMVVRVRQLVEDGTLIG
jgi:hypothetical protein